MVSIIKSYVAGLGCRDFLGFNVGRGFVSLTGDRVTGVPDL